MATRAAFSVRMRPRFITPLLIAASATAQPVITTQPASASVYVNDALTLQVAANGTPPFLYQWFKDGVAIAGATLPSLAVTASLTPPATISGFLYTVTVTDFSGTATSSPAGIIVTRRPQTIAFNAPSSAAAASSVTLEPAASSGLAVTLSVVSGSATLAGRVLTGNGGAVVVRASQGGNAAYEPAASIERTINFTSGAISPFITSAPSDQTVLAGAAVTLRAVSIGTPAPAYQWTKNGAPIAGATGATLTFATVALSDAGRYTIAATNVAGTAGATAEVVVRAAPVVVTPPATQTAVAGRDVTLSAEFTGFPAPGLQWRKDGRAIAGATSTDLTLRAVTPATAGRYDVVATNALGSATSAAAVLTVTLRDFSGTYRGTVGSAAGEIALLVRRNGPATALAHLTTAAAGISTPAIAVGLNGAFSATVPLIALAGRNVTLRGTIDETAGLVTGSIPELNLTFTAARAEPASPEAAQTGLYSGGVIGGATAASALVGPDGRAFMLLLNGPAVDSAAATLSTEGRLTTGTHGKAAVDVGFSSSGMRGTWRPANGTAATLAGVTEALAGRQRLVNLSVRGATAPEAPMITGFAIGGTAAKQVLIRVAGPALARAPFNLAGALNDPSIQLYRVNNVIGQNNDWGSPAAGATALAAAAARAGAFPFAAGSADAALLTTLPPGVYSVQTEGGTGIVLAEIYEAPAADETPGSRRLVNVSTLGPVAPGVPLIAGFVIDGPGPQRVLVRAAGAALAGAPFNVAGALPNPQLTIFQGAAQLRTNDDWFREAEVASIREAATRANAFAFGAQSPDAALLLFLEPGAYTAVIGASAAAPAAQTTGLVLVELYDATP